MGEGRPSSPLFPTQQYSRFQRTVNRTRATTVRFFLQREKTVELTRYFSRSAKVKGRPGCFLRTGSRSGISILPACVDVDASRGGPSETAILPGKKGESAVLMKFSGLVGIRGSLFQRVPKREPGQPGCSREAAHLTTPLQAPRPRPWAWRVGPTGHAAAHPAVPGPCDLPTFRPRDLAGRRPPGRHGFRGGGVTLVRGRVKPAPQIVGVPEGIYKPDSVPDGRFVG